MPDWLKLYHALPWPLKFAAASLRGYYLRSWRYGPETERLVEEALEREHWRPEQWKKWQEQRLAFVLHRAATRVPYYRAQWSARQRAGDRASWEHLENWPLLEKEAVRANPLSFVADDCDTRRMFLDHTSGTTGTPLSLWSSRETVRAWYALLEARLRRWAGVSRHQRWAILGGQVVTPVTRRAPPFWVWNAGMKQLYCSTHHISPDNVRHFWKALRGWGVTHLIAYPSAASLLAQLAVKGGLPPLNLEVTFTNAEPLTEDQRNHIRMAISRQVRETYGMAESVCGASECEKGVLHLWPEAGIVETRRESGGDGGDPAAAADLVCTGLLNADMPLIRYAVGDRGAVQKQSSVCSCGRRLPLLQKIEGRTKDVLVTRDRRRIYWLNPVFFGLPVREGQIIQDSLESVTIRVVPADGYSGGTTHLLVERLKARMGDIRVSVEEVASIPRTSAGKFRAVVCNLTPEDRKQLGLLD